MSTRRPRAIDLQPARTGRQRQPKRSHYAQPDATVINANCLSGYHYNCTRMSCTCPCGHGVRPAPTMPRLTLPPTLPPKVT